MKLKFMLLCQVEDSGRTKKVRYTVEAKDFAQAQQIFYGDIYCYKETHPSTQLIGIILLDKEPSITCPKCGMTSFHPQDISHRFCGNCHQFHSDM